MIFKRQFTFDRVVRLLLGAGLVVGLIYLLGLIRDVLTPFAIAVLLAYMINPLVCILQRWIPNRKAAVATTLLLVLVLAGAALVILMPILAREFAALGSLLRQTASLQLPAWLHERLPSDLWAGLVQWVSAPDFQELFTPEQLWHLVETGVQKALPGAWRLLSGATAFLLGLLGLLVVAFYLVFLLVDYNEFQAAWPLLIPEDYRGKVMDFLREFADGMRRYFRGQASIAGIVGILFAIGFWLIGLPMGVLLGLFIGLLNMIPYLQVIGLVPAFLLAALNALVTGGSVWVALGLCGLVFAVVQTFQDLVLTPRILGRSLGMSPITILLSLSIWGRLLGVLGMLIALPMTGLLLTYYRQLVVPSRHPQSESPPVPAPPPLTPGSS